MRVRIWKELAALSKRLTPTIVATMSLRTFWDASNGEVSARGNFPTRRTATQSSRCCAVTSLKADEEMSFDKPLIRVDKDIDGNLENDGRSSNSTVEVRS